MKDICHRAGICNNTRQTNKNKAKTLSTNLDEARASCFRQIPTDLHIAKLILSNETTLDRADVMLCYAMLVNEGWNFVP